MCDSLQITCTELEVQPFEWVENMLEYLNQKNKSQEAKSKLEQARSQTGRRKRV